MGLESAIAFLQVSLMCGPVIPSFTPLTRIHSHSPQRRALFTPRGAIFSENDGFVSLFLCHTEWLSCSIYNPKSSFAKYIAPHIPRRLDNGADASH